MQVDKFTHATVTSLTIVRARALSLSPSLSFARALSLSQFKFFNLSVLYWHDKNYTFVLPKQLQLGCSQVVHIWINRNKNLNNNSNKTNI